MINVTLVASARFVHSFQLRGCWWLSMFFSGGEEGKVKKGVESAQWDFVGGNILPQAMPVVR
jgi:hypothetical protein